MGEIVVKKTASLNADDWRWSLFLDLYTDFGNRFYEVRPIFTMKKAPGFTLESMEVNVFNKDTLLMSLPMYVTYGRVKVDEIGFERLIIMLKDNHNKEHIDIIKKALTKQLD
jgi:hypothetical protein